jgi:hypothetical protein
MADKHVILELLHNFAVGYSVSQSTPTMSLRFLLNSLNYNWSLTLLYGTRCPCLPTAAVSHQKIRTEVGACHGSGAGGPGSMPGSVHVGFVVDKVALGQVFPEYFCLPVSVSFRLCSITSKRTKNNHLHFRHRVARETLTLRYARSFSCGALLH